MIFSSVDTVSTLYCRVVVKNLYCPGLTKTKNVIEGTTKLTTLKNMRKKFFKSDDQDRSYRQQVKRLQQVRSTR